MSRWEPDIDRNPGRERSTDPGLDHARARFEARERAFEQRTKGQRTSQTGAVDRAAFDSITRERVRLKSRQYRDNRRRERRTGRTQERVGHRRELGRTREKGPDWTSRTNACLREVGIYRSASHSDLVNTHFSGNRFAADKGLQKLVRSGVMQEHQVRGPKGGNFTVYTLTKSGAALAERLAVKDGLDPEQRVWSGIVKPREAAHDADVAKACRKEIEALTDRGARLRRVLIDAELKSILARRSEAARVKHGKEEADRARMKAATELHLPVDNEGHVQVPDAQIQYVDEAGNIGRVNVEVTTDQYSKASVKAKSGAGFAMHGSGKGGQGANTRTSLSSLGGGGGRRGGGRSGRDSAAVEI